MAQRKNAAARDAAGLPPIKSAPSKLATIETKDERIVDLGWQEGEVAYCLALVVTRGSARVGSGKEAVAAYLTSIAVKAPAPLDAGLRLAAAELTGRANGTMPVKHNAWSNAAQHLSSVILQAVGDRV
jgi:hypothetical protein